MPSLWFRKVSGVATEGDDPGLSRTAGNGNGRRGATYHHSAGVADGGCGDVPEREPALSAVRRDRGRAAATTQSTAARMYESAVARMHESTVTRMYESTGAAGRHESTVRALQRPAPGQSDADGPLVVAHGQSTGSKHVGGCRWSHGRRTSWEPIRRGPSTRRSRGRRMTVSQFKDKFRTPLYQQHVSHTLASRACGPRPHMRS